MRLTTCLTEARTLESKLSPRTVSFFPTTFASIVLLFCWMDLHSCGTFLKAQRILLSTGMKICSRFLKSQLQNLVSFNPFFHSVGASTCPTIQEYLINCDLIWKQSWFCLEQERISILYHKTCEITYINLEYKWIKWALYVTWEFDCTFAFIEGTNISLHLFGYRKTQLPPITYWLRKVAALQLHCYQIHQQMQLRVNQ